jgi:hypothetical protein
MNLVSAIVDWVANTYFEGDPGSILVDSAVAGPGMRPPSVYGYVPDVFVIGGNICGLLIGEAKTCRDLENRHTEAQLGAFLRRCDQEPDSTFVMAVPWQMERFAKSLLRRLQSKNGVCSGRTVVLEKLRG